MAEQDQLYLVRKAPRDMSRLRRFEGITRYEAFAKFEIGQNIAEGEDMALALGLWMVLEDSDDEDDDEDDDNDDDDMLIALTGVAVHIDGLNARLFDLKYKIPDAIDPLEGIRNRGLDTFTPRLCYQKLRFRKEHIATLQDTFAFVVSKMNKLYCF